MRSGWIDSEAQTTIARYGNQDIGPDLALRIYSARLLGREPELVRDGVPDLRDFFRRHLDTEGREAIGQGINFDVHE